MWDPSTRCGPDARGISRRQARTGIPRLGIRQWGRAVTTDPRFSNNANNLPLSCLQKPRYFRLCDDIPSRGRRKFAPVKNQVSYAHLVAGFVAQGHAITVCKTGADSGISSRDWSQAVRGKTTAVALSVRDDRSAEALHHQMQDTATEARLNGQRVVGFDNKGDIYTSEGKY